MKKLITITIVVMLFTLLYFRAENPRSHFSKYSIKPNELEKLRNPAKVEDKKKSLPQK